MALSIDVVTNRRHSSVGYVGIGVGRVRSLPELPKGAVVRITGIDLEKPRGLLVSTSWPNPLKPAETVVVDRFSIPLQFLRIRVTR